MEDPFSRSSGVWVLGFRVSRLRFVDRTYEQVRVAYRSISWRSRSDSYKPAE